MLIVNHFLAGILFLALIFSGTATPPAISEQNKS